MKLHSYTIMLAALVAATISTCSYAAIVTPMLGGGQVDAPMIHIDIFYDYGTDTMSATVDTSYGTPMLRPLSPGDEFDPAEPWSVLDGMAYNAQYGWTPGGIFIPPEGGAVWIELISQSPDLETYAGRKTKGTYEPIFGTDGSSMIWEWPGSMTHNTNAVLNPTETLYSATYKVYFGDETTGLPIAGYDDTTVTLEWTAIPEPATLFLFVMGSSLLLLNRRTRRISR